MNVSMKKNITVDIPTPPNFIKVNGKMENLAFFSKEELKDISKNMYTMMLDRRRQQQKQDGRE